MRNSSRGIRTSHAGKLPGPPGWTDRPDQVASAVSYVVKRQREIGIDCIGDGEFWNGRTIPSYGTGLNGVTVRDVRPGEVGSSREFTRERDQFPSLYADMDRVGTLFCVPGEAPVPAVRKKMVVTGPLSPKDDGALAREIAAFKAGRGAAPAEEEAFICVLAPGWVDHFVFNEYYKTDEEFVYALAEALRPQYRAVTDAGFILQLRSTMRSPASRRKWCAIISAGAAGTVRMSPTCRCATSPTSPCR